MSNIQKITIEKRVFKVGNNENFILEYPSNYEEVVNRKLNNLQKEYDDAVSNTINNNEDINKEKEIIAEEKTENKETEKENNKKVEKKEENDINKESQNYNYYQPIGGVDSFMNDNDDDDIKDNLNNNNEKKPDVHLEPQEGFIEIKNKKIEKENKTDNKNDEKEEKEENNEDEFYEVEEKENENEEHKNENSKINKEEIKDDKKDNKRSSSPVHDPESVKLSMKSLNFKTPIWAENMSDKDFINMARNMISSKKKIP